MTIATATPTANAVPKAESDGKIHKDWIDAADARTLLESLTVGPIALSNGAAVTVDSVATSKGTVAWRLLLVKTDGKRVSLRVEACLDAAGTGADWTEYGEDDQGNWTGSLEVDVSSGSFRLRVTAAEVNWSAYAASDFLDGA